MARVGTSNLNLGMWTDGENPGAGSQSVDSTGLNGDKIKLDTAVGAGHNADGSHKANIIDGPSLKTTVADGSTLQLTGSPLKLNVKGDGIQGTHLNANVVDNDSLEVSAPTGTKTLRIKTIKAGKILGTGTGKAVDGVSIGLNGSNELCVLDYGILSTKLAHSNTRTKILLVFGIDPSTGYGTVGNIVTTATVGVPIERAGCVTAVTVIDAAGTVAGATAVYNGAAANHFAAHSKITVYESAPEIDVLVNGSIVTGLTPETAAAKKIVTVEIELDD